MVATAGATTAVLGAPVRWREVPDSLAGGQELSRVRSGRMLVTADQVWFEDEWVRLLVRGTDEVWIVPRPGRSRAEVAHYAYGFAAAVLLLHAGRFTMHASAVRTAAGATIVVAGDSGAGKSTTCTALARHGGRFLVDDVSPLRPTESGVLVEPYARPVHLTDDAVVRLDLHPERRSTEDDPRGPVGKTALELTATEPAAAHRVDHLVVLAAASGVGPDPVVRGIAGAERLRMVVRHSNVSGLASFGSRAEPYFEWAAAVADRADLVEVRRDVDADSLEAVVRVLAGDPVPG